MAIQVGAATVYAKRVDVVGTITYIGEAVVGTLDAGSTWRISKLDATSTPDLSITWASGTAAFDKVWNDRASFTYSQE